jgi:GTP-binding protein
VSPFDVIDARFVSESRSATQFPPESAPEIAFAGRSNVGKSTLLNAVAQRRALARTSRTPGATRGIIMFDARLRSGTELRLVDLPGYGFAQRAQGERRAWGPLVERYLLERGSLRGVVILVDARRGPEREENELIEFLQTAGRPFALVMTKVDKLTRSERGVLLDTVARRHGVRPLAVSGETGEGREALMRSIVSMAGVANATSREPGSGA